MHTIEKILSGPESELYSRVHKFISNNCHKVIVAKFEEAFNEEDAYDSCYDFLLLIGYE